MQAQVIADWLLKLPEPSKHSTDILALIKSGKYRPISLDPKFEQKLDAIVLKAISENKPIHFSLPFGGFKKWQLPDSPNLNWAEVITLRYFCEYLSRLCAVYNPGAVLQYMSDEIFLHQMNLYPKEDLQIYNQQLSNLLRWFQQYLPNNLRLKYSYIRDEIEEEELFSRIEVFLPEAKEEFSRLDVEIQQKKIANAKRNLYDKAGARTEDELMNCVYIHEVFLNKDWDEGVTWAFAPDMIPIGFTKQGWGLPLRSSPASRVQFWVGYGGFMDINGRLVPKILSYEQFNNAKVNYLEAPRALIDAIEISVGLSQIPVFE